MQGETCENCISFDFHVPSLTTGRNSQTFEEINRKYIETLLVDYTRVVEHAKRSFVRGPVIPHRRGASAWHGTFVADAFRGLYLREIPTSVFFI